MRPAFYKFVEIPSIPEDDAGGIYVFQYARLKSTLQSVSSHVVGTGPLFVSKQGFSIAYPLPCELLEG